jgi:hypothetical protein
MTPDVANVRTLDNFELMVTFEDGEVRRFSMLPYLVYPAYKVLSDPYRFNAAHVANGTVAWSDEVDISPDTLYIAGQGEVATTT